MGKPSRDRINLIICVLLALATVAVYWQVVGFDFCYYDDNIYVAENPAVQQGFSATDLGWAFTTYYMCNWHPLTWMSYFLDTEMAEAGSWVFDFYFGRGNAGFYHLSNAALHVANAIILFLVLFELTGFRWRSAFVAALFALHPLHVESAAWIAERKDVLSTLFWFLTMWAYVRWVRRPRPRGYAMLIGAFVLGLMSKPMLVSLPIILLLLDVWPLRRFEPLAMEAGARTAIFRLIREKLPLFALSAVSCIVAMWAQTKGGAVQSIQEYPLWVRALNALNSAWGYLWKMVWPKDLAAFYPHPGTEIAIPAALGAGLFLFAVTILVVRLRRSKPYLMVGWLWYLITLVPVLGLVQVGSQSMADRYTYVPLVGIFIAISWAIPDLLSGLKNEGLRRGILTAAAALVLAALIPVTYAQIGVWKNPESLYGHAIAVTKSNAPAYMSYGCVMVERGDIEKALTYFREALRINPRYIDARYNYADALSKKGDLPAAEREFKRVIGQYPRHPYAHVKLGDIYQDQDELNLAIRHYRLALRDRGALATPNQEAIIHNSLGICLARTCRFDEAISEFERALSLDPSFAMALDNLEKARASRGDDP